MQAKSVRRFSREEARSKIGTKVRTRAAFWNVPFGSAGKVIGVHEVSEDMFDVVIEWESSTPFSASKNRFAKEPFDEFLSVVNGDLRVTENHSHTR